MVERRRAAPERRKFCRSEPQKASDSGSRAFRRIRLSDIAEERSSTVEALERRSFEDEMRLVKQGSLSTKFSLYRKRVVGTDALEAYSELEPRRCVERTHLLGSSSL